MFNFVSFCLISNDDAGRPTNNDAGRPTDDDARWPADDDTRSGSAHDDAGPTDDAVPCTGTVYAVPTRVSGPTSDVAGDDEPTTGSF